MLLALFAAAAAAAIAWTVAAERRAADLRRALSQTETALLAARTSLADAQKAHAALDASFAAERRSAGEKLALLADARDTLKDAFAAVSADLLAQNNTRFLELAKQKLGELQTGAVADLAGRQKAIDDLVQPLRESLNKVDAKLQDVDRERASSHAAIAEQLRSLTLAQASLQSETGRLARALRSPNVRGQWGELQLRRVLEAAGMTPLDGLTILDFTRVLAGPYCTMQLADLGARVIKIEQPGRGDDTRAWGPPFVRGESAYFLSINRNKESVALDLKHSRARGILDALVSRADVIVENFRPGTMERLGLGYDTLAATHSRLVYCSISGFGQTGPRRAEAGYDAMMQAEAGLMSITGAADGPAFRLGVAISDIVSGLFATQGITLALLARERARAEVLDEHVSAR